MKIYIEPRFRGPDEGEGGIRRIVEAQNHLLPGFGFEIVDDLTKADIVATHAGQRPDVPSHIPWVVHTHGLYWSEYSWPKWCHGLNQDVIDAMRRADHVTAPSEWVAYALRRGMWIKPTVLYHGIYPEQWAEGDNQGFILWNKTRQDSICRADVVTTLSGMAPDLAFVSTFGEPRANVKLTGRLPFEEGKQYIENCGVYLCTTRETMGIGTLEAMACGKPIVGWDWGGQREIITHQVDGWLSPPGDYADLMQGIRWAIENYAEVGANARTKALDEFNWVKVMAKYAELYKRLYEEKAEERQKPAVSIIMPNYNLGKYLPDAIESVKAQTLENWELIIVDDCSTEVDGYNLAGEEATKDNRIRLTQTPENLYLAGALNFGIAQARGRHIIPLDADNMLAPDALEILSGALDASREVDIAYGRCKFVKEDGVTPDDTVSPDGVSTWPWQFKYDDQIRQRNQIPSSAMYRTELTRRAGGYRGRWLTSEDADNWLRLSTIGGRPNMVTGAVTLIYRQREDSMSRSYPIPDYADWYPHSRNISLTPFGVQTEPPARVNEGIAWHVPSYEPIHIAVVIPVGPGHERHYYDAVDSVFAQAYQSWECIIVNDTGAPLMWEPAWATIINLDGAGHGPAHARNVGIEASIASLFVPLDADDYLQPDALEEMVNVYRQTGGVVYSQWIDAKGPGESDIYDPPEYDCSLLISKGAIHAVTALYSKQDWVSLGGFDENLSHWEDWDYQIALANNGICGVKIAKPLFTYRKWTGLRREENMEAFNEGRDTIQAKWPQFWEGGEQLMACRGCGGGGGQRVPAPPIINQNSVAPSSFQARLGWVVMRYMGNSQGTQRIRGPVTGTYYRFGNNAGHQTRYVYEHDSPGLMAMTENGAPKFELVSGDLQGSAPAPVIAASTARAATPQESVVTVAERPAEVGGEPLANPVGLSQSEEDAATWEVPQVSISELRQYVPKLQTWQLEAWLADEKANANRNGAVNVLSDTIKRRNTP